MNGWTPEEVDQLIGIVSSNAVLYDQSLAGYSNRNTIDLAWRSVSLKFNNKSDKDCSKKWQLLRAGLRKRRYEYLPTGSDSASKKKKRVYFDALSFLDVHMAERPTETNAPETSIGNSDNEDVVTLVDTENMPSGPPSSSSTSTHVGLFTVGEDGILEAEDADPTSSSVNINNNTTPSCSRKRSKKKSNLSNEVDETFTQYLKSKMEKHPREKSAMGLFFESIVAEVNELERCDQMELRLMILNFIKEKMTK
ncbi:hypothetical protein ILUMI_04579 [Ignelater luminosus]|uniref:MADF domain-containing protein n=1 Tax=Ignelater luminosus TaxID=2038154 RepID=A0A8K0DDL5_IGNLU|nr:hypothetical protein ILUMI_04579 [Ignelater luminosus]